MALAIYYLFYTYSFLSADMSVHHMSVMPIETRDQGVRSSGTGVNSYTWVLRIEPGGSLEELKVLLRTEPSLLLS